MLRVRSLGIFLNLYFSILPRRRRREFFRATPGSFLSCTNPTVATKTTSISIPTWVLPSSSPPHVEWCGAAYWAEIIGSQFWFVFWYHFDILFFSDAAALGEKILVCRDGVLRTRTQKRPNGLRAGLLRSNRFRVMFVRDTVGGSAANSVTLTVCIHPLEYAKSAKKTGFKSQLSPGK